MIEFSLADAKLKDDLSREVKSSLDKIALMIHKDADSALEQLESLELLCDDIVDPAKRVESLLRILVLRSEGEVYTKRLGESLKTVLRAKSVADSVVFDPESRLYGEIIARLAMVYVALGDLPNSLTFSHLLASIADQLDDDKLMSVALNSLGIVYGEMEDYELSIAQFEKMLELACQTDPLDAFSIVRSYANLSFVHVKKKAFDKSVEIAKKGLEYKDQVDHPLIVGSLHNQLVRGLLEMNKVEEAEKYYLDSLHYVRMFEGDLLTVDSHVVRGRLLLMKGKLEDAEIVAQDALGRALSHQLVLAEINCYELLSDIASAQADHEKALMHFKKYHHAKKTMLNEQTAERIRFLRISHEVDATQKEAEIYRLKTEELSAVVAERTADLRSALGREQKLKRDLLHTLEWSEKANELRSKAITTISHEFRTPLTVIGTSAEMLTKHIDKMPPERRENHASLITNSIEQLTALVQQVESVGNLKPDNLHPDYVKIAFDEWASQFEKNLHQEIKSERVSVVFEQTNTSQINVDTTKITAIVANLITNALNYSSPETPVIVSLMTNADHLFIEVADNGIGIREDELNHLFELFYRSERVREVSGTGAGLYVAKLLVSALDGEITAHSDGEGRGATFSVCIPTSG